MSFSVNVDLLNELFQAYNSAKVYMPNTIPSFGIFVRDYCFSHQPVVQAVVDRSRNGSENVSLVANNQNDLNDSLAQPIVSSRSLLSQTTVQNKSEADLLDRNNNTNNNDNKRKSIVDISEIENGTDDGNDDSEQNPFQKRAKLMQKETDSGVKFASSLAHKNLLCKDRAKQFELAAANVDTSDGLKRVAKYLDVADIDINANSVELFAVAQIVQNSNDHKTMKAYANSLQKLMKQVTMFVVFLVYLNLFIGSRTSRIKS